jgi:mycoredoxin
MELLVYSAEWCRDCREAKRFLAKHAIPYTEVNIETTPGAADALIAATGKKRDSAVRPQRQVDSALSPR